MEQTITKLLRTARASLCVDTDVKGVDSVSSLGGDSMDLVELVCDIEDEFNVPVEDGTFSLATTFDEIAAWLDAR